MKNIPAIGGSNATTSFGMCLRRLFMVKFLLMVYSFLRPINQSRLWLWRVPFVEQLVELFRDNSLVVHLDWSHADTKSSHGLDGRRERVLFNHNGVVRITESSQGGFPRLGVSHRKNEIPLLVWDLVDDFGVGLQEVS
ncbi:hypothetical protein OGAPHI_004006 [Ogataea philodendri]|uniref:Uncharacterized protein n=1 Tax=Ogataea philodendri TaxID=1378263 RepID=A0A9P8P5D5_9ASCO|nr:uncharacterized protein OGAPHI_004006 [Ogataea philodendri]KAH3665818.1 hypothetical protein OGAPHI_004006 [Ogataea philodendri]